MDQFHYISYAQEVVFGLGSLAGLAEAVERFGWQRLMLCTNHSMRTNGHASLVESIIGDRLVVVFDHVQPHVQDIQVNEVLAFAIEKDVNAIIGLGGGSPIGMAKAVAFALEEGPTGQPAQAVLSTNQPLIPVIAIPTTYAGSEMTPTYGITHTDETPPRKVTVNNPKIVPKIVIYDPNLTLDLPAELTASTGINALAHCIEAMYSKSRNPLSTAAATSGVRHIFNSLLRCYQEGQVLESRSEMLLGAHLAGLSLASVSMGLHHGLCHVLGGSANIPHGIANSIILPHVIRFNADVVAPQLLPAAEAMGIIINGTNPMVVIEELSQRIFDLIGQMNLPQRLRDADVKSNEITNLAKLGFHNRTVQNNPKPITDAIQIEQLLKDAW
jgi:alcohol dehydrogenase class IV